MRPCIWAMMLLSVASGAPFPVIDANFFKLRLLHTNDLHARFEQVSRSSGKCTEYDAAQNMCYGGFARLKTALKEEIDKANKENISVLSLNAGDSYQGTVWYSILKWKVVSHFLNMLKIDVMSLGNHEFDDGIDGLVPFLRENNIPTVTCNIDYSLEPEFAKVAPKNSIVLERGGQKIGIIGYVTPQTTVLAVPGQLKFEEEIESLNREAKKLKESGINIIIALGHSGYDVDMLIAQNVSEVDVVVGGHSHTFFYSGKPPDVEIPLGPYPVMVTQPSGRLVPVVQAYAFTKYLGKLDVTFDSNGEVVEASGNPILLDHKIQEDPEVLKDLKEWQKQLNESLSEVVGRTRVLLEGQCRFSECNFGNLMTDAYIYHAAKNHTGPYWTQAAIALQQGGGIRATINATGNNGNITKEDMLTSMPFVHTISVVKVSGKIFLDALEWSVSRYDFQGKAGRGEFLQLSGVKVKYDLSKRSGSRVVSVKVRCASCNIPAYHDLNLEEDYNLIMPTFLYFGGDNFKMFEKNGTEIFRFDLPDTNIVMNYIKTTEVVYSGLEDRIEFVSDGLASASITLKPNLIYLTLILFFFALK